MRILGGVLCSGASDSVADDAEGEYEAVSADGAWCCGVCSGSGVEGDVCVCG